MIGIVADDITGANDIGLMYAKNNWLTKVISPYTALKENEDARADTLILETNSRCDSREKAYEKVAAATRMLMRYKPELYVKKTCSVFRGNIGVEFDAMLDTLNRDFAVVVAAFPDNGRTTVKGIHYVWGEKLEDTAFRNDPAHPMLESDLVAILSSQTKRKVHLLNLETLRKGPEEIRRTAEAARQEGGYLICDSETQEDLRTLAEAFSGEQCIFGSSAIGEEIPRFRKNSSLLGIDRSLLNFPSDNGKGELLVAGSVTPQTEAQVKGFIASGHPALPIRTEFFFGNDRQSYTASIVESASASLSAGEPVLLFTTCNEEGLEASYKAASQAGIDKLEANIRVSRTMGEITEKIYEKTSFTKLIVAGGETSNHVCEAMGFRGNVVLDEIAPGLPAGLSIGDQTILVVLKSGSFGKPEFLLKAIEHLRNL